MNISKKTAFGATAAAAALIVVGISAPAMADEGSWSASKGWQQTSFSERSSESTTVVAPQVDVLGGDILTGDVLGGGIGNGDILGGDIGNGNAVASGNDVTAPVLSGNDTAVGNGNSTAVGNVSDTSIGTAVSDLVDSVVDSSVLDSTVLDSTLTDVVDVEGILGDVTSVVGLNGLFQD